MNSRYVLAPHAAQDLVDIWLYIKQQSSESSANRVESVIRNRKDLTDETVKFFPVYSYLIVYRPETKPLQVVSILHGRRDVGKVLEERR